jgi:hypothetical protein
MVIGKRERLAHESPYFLLTIPSAQHSNSGINASIAMLVSCAALVTGAAFGLGLELTKFLILQRL